MSGRVVVVMGETSNNRAGTFRRLTGGMRRLSGWHKGVGIQRAGLRWAIDVGKRSDRVIEDRTDLGFLLGM